MKSVIITGPRTVACVEKKIPSLKENEILIRVIQMGICGSDLERVANGLEKYQGITIGHEVVGIVEKVGLECSRIVPGDRVIPIPLIPCHLCPDCQEGNFSLCKNYSFVGSRIDGGAAEYVKIPEINAIKVPDSVSNDEATLLEPLTVAMHALLRSEKLFGARLMVIGGGAIGLIALQLARIAGAQATILSDVVPMKLELAKKLGADMTVNAAESNAQEKINAFMNGGVHSVVVETSGSSSGKIMSLNSSLPKGEVLFVGGMNRDLVLVPDQYSQILRRELTIKGCWMNYSAAFPGEEWSNGLKIIQDHRIDLSHLITHRFSFSQACDAFDVLFNQSETPIKIIMHPDKTQEEV